MATNVAFAKRKRSVYSPAMDGIDRAIQVAGTAAKLAGLVGVVPMTVTQWRRRGQVPAERCRAIEAATNGEVTRYQLRPDVFGEAPDREVA